jgi:hypothetical protein
MSKGARRLLALPLQGYARRAALALCVLAGFLAPEVGLAQTLPVILKAQYAEPTTRYDHGILGDAVEWGALELAVELCAGCARSDRQNLVIRLPKTRVFEDLVPRLIKDETGRVLVMVVETDLRLGARLALYDHTGLVDATPFIGSTHRWLAPVGAADLDGDGFTEVAYVEKPHLSKELKVWRLRGGKLRFVASLGGLTNHRIGEDFISGGLRDCGGGLEIITVNGNWSKVMATQLKNDRLNARSLAVFGRQSDLAAALSCAK